MNVIEKVLAKASGNKEVRPGDVVAAETRTTPEIRSPHDRTDRTKSSIPGTAGMEPEGASTR